MEDNVTEKIRALLADPQAVERIAAIAGTLGASPGGTPSGGTPGGSMPPEPTPPVPPAVNPPQGPPPDPRLDLLRALRPLVAEEKRERLEDLLRIASVASLLGNFKK